MFRVMVLSLILASSGVSFGESRCISLDSAKNILEVNLKATERYMDREGNYHSQLNLLVQKLRRDADGYRAFDDNYDYDTGLEVKISCTGNYQSQETSHEW